jgi:CDP-diglyceride synthetase
MFTNLPLSYSIVAGMMACFLFILGIFLEKEKKKSKILLIWACFFLAISFAGLESAFYAEGYNIFESVLKLNFPLFTYFAVWFGFIIWLFESRKEREIWIILLILLIITVLIAMNCMNCIKV